MRNASGPAWETSNAGGGGLNTEAAAAAVYVQPMSERFSSLFSLRPKVRAAHATFLSVLEGCLLTEEKGVDDVPELDRLHEKPHALAVLKRNVDHEITTSSPLTVRNGGAATSVAEVKRNHDEWLKLSNEVARLKEYYEPGIVFLSAKVSFSGKQEKEKESGSDTSVVVQSEEDMHQLKQRLQDAKERLQHAQEAHHAKVNTTKDLLGHEMAAQVVAKLDEGRQAPDRIQPVGRIEEELFSACVAVWNEEKAVLELEMQVQEAKRVWYHPWQVAGRLEQHCLQLLNFTVAIAERIANTTVTTTQKPRSGGGGSGGGGGGGGGQRDMGRFPTTSKSSQHGELLQDWRKQVERLALGQLLPYEKKSPEEQLAEYEGRTNHRQHQVRVAQRHYESVQTKVQDLVGDDIFENFETTAKTPAGAADARPLVRELHEAWQNIVAVERVYEKAITELREQERYLGSVSSVLERLSATVESLLRVFPATLSELTERCRGGLEAVFLPSGVPSSSPELWNSAFSLSAGIGAVHLHPFTPNLIASGSKDGTVRVWRAEGAADSQDRQTWSCIETITGHSGSVDCVQWHPTLPALASGFSDGSVVVWSPAEVFASECWAADPEAVLKKFRPAKLSGHKRKATCVKWHPHDANVIASCSTDDTVRIWTAKDRTLSSWSCGATLQVKCPCRSIDWHTGGRALLVGHYADSSESKFTISIFVPSPATPDSGLDLKAWERTAELTGHTGSVGSVLWHRSGEAFASSGSDGTVRVWCQPPGAANYCRWNCIASLVGASKGEKFEKPTSCSRKSGPPGALGWSPDGNAIITALDDHTMRVDARPANSPGFESWKAIATLKGHRDTVVTIHWQGNVIVSGSEDKTIRVWHSPAVPSAAPLRSLLSALETTLLAHAASQGKLQYQTHG